MKPGIPQKFRLGVFVSLGLAVFLIAVYFIGEKQNMFGSTAYLSATFNNVNGLQVGNSVRYSGINVGTVRAIEMSNDTCIRVDMSIDTDILRHIKQDAVATIGSDGLVGSMIVNIVPGNGNFPPIAAGGQINTYSRIRTEDLLKTLNVTNENAALLTVDLLKITKEINQGKGSIGILLNDTAMANDLKKTMANLENTTSSASRSLASVEEIVSGLKGSESVIGLMKDTATSGKVRRILKNLESASVAIDTTVKQFNRLATNAKNGKGAINYLSNDPKAVKQIDTLLLRLNSAGKLLNEDLEALQHSFLLRGYFRKQDKKQKQQEK